MDTRQRLFAVFSFRDDVDLVPELLENLEGVVDDYVAYDDRHHSELWQHEGRRRRHILDMARQRGADWVLCLDPDERLEEGAGPRIRRLIKRQRKIIYGFRIRDLWTPTQYRVDGIWGKRVRLSLFPLLPDQTYMDRFIHSEWAPQNPDYVRAPTTMNIYHLKMIDPDRRVQRRRLYNTLDPTLDYQSIGYDYLTDESGLTLETIPPGRGYRPAYNPEMFGGQAQTDIRLDRAATREGMQ
jgi:hypothetical protein